MTCCSSSSLRHSAPEEFDNVLEAIQSGQPTAIFEDPRPIFMAAPATGEPKMPPGGMGDVRGGGGPQPKGDMKKIVESAGPRGPRRNRHDGSVLPRHRLAGVQPVLEAPNPRPSPTRGSSVAGKHPAEKNSINDQSPITSGLSEIFFPVPGGVKPDKSSDLKFTKLATTGEMAGTVSFQAFMDNRRTASLMKRSPRRPQGRANHRGADHRQTAGGQVDVRRGRRGGESCQEPACRRRASRPAGRRKKRPRSRRKRRKGAKDAAKPAGGKEPPKPEAKEAKTAAWTWSTFPIST